MNNDLISREALKLDLAKEIKTNDMGLWLKILLVIDNAPTVEYPFYQEAYQTGYEEGKNERPQGEWIIIKSPLSNETIVKCNKCGEEFIGNDVEDYNYCPICGADMRQKSNCASCNDFGDRCGECEASDDE